MAVSGTTSFTMNRDEVITDALLEIGGVAIGGTPTTAQITHASRRLNTILKAWQSEHIYLNAIVTASVETTASQNYVTFPAGVRRIDHMWSTVNGTDTALNKLAIDDYDVITDKTTTGEPTDYFVDEGTSKVFLYPVPDAVYTLNYRGDSILDDLTSSTHNFALPVPALDMIVKALAYELSVPYGLAQDRQQSFYARAKEAKLAYLAHYNQQYNPTDIVVPKGVLI